MSKLKKQISLQSYAFQLRKKLLNGNSLENLLDSHNKHQEMLGRLFPIINPNQLKLADRFAWKFIREINILNQRFSRANSADISVKAFPDSQEQTANKIISLGVYQNLEEIVRQVQSIWFSEMKGPPKVIWLKHFSTRKLAHYSFSNDEIAFSLIFDSPDAPPEILSYLAYHELLHRQVGSHEVNGRRYAHTPEFKNHEQLFPNWQQMDKQIADYILNTQ